MVLKKSEKTKSTWNISQGKRWKKFGRYIHWKSKWDDRQVELNANLSVSLTCIYCRRCSRTTLNIALIISKQTKQINHPSSQSISSSNNKNHYHLSCSYRKIPTSWACKKRRKLSANWESEKSLWKTHPTFSRRNTEILLLHGQLGAPGTCMALPCSGESLEL